MSTSKIKETLSKNTMLLALVFIMCLFQLLISINNKGSLFSPANITNLINQNGYVVILAIGMLLCILTGGNIDLSIGSVVALVGALAGVLIVNMKLNVWLSLFLCLLLGLAIGAWQGFWIAYVRIPAFIVTLAGMLTFRGLALVILNGKTIAPFPASFTRVFNTYLPVGAEAANKLMFSLIVGVAICLIMIVAQVISRINKVRKKYAVESLIMMIIRLTIISAVVMVVSWLLGQDKGMPVILVTLAVVVLAYTYFTSKTVPGRHLYAMGGNEKAAKLSGINTNRTLFFAYANMGFLSAVAAMVCVARYDSASTQLGTSFEMDAIASCYIGGASAYGGVGKVSGAVIGALFMGVVNNGMSIMGIDANWQKVVKGSILLAAVVVDIVLQKRRTT